jgi:hypothetical protein
MGTPSKLSVIRKVVTVARARPTLLCSCWATHYHHPFFPHTSHIIWHTTTTPPILDIRIRISVTPTFGCRTGRVVWKMKYNFDLEISTLKLNLGSGTQFQVHLKFNTRHLNFNLNGLKSNLVGDHNTQSARIYVLEGVGHPRSQIWDIYNERDCTGTTIPFYLSGT